jgi:hypothetical protein
MTQFGSNEEFFDTLKHLIYGWCDERLLLPLALLLPKYVAFNGMTDGWLELQAALRNLRSHSRGRPGDPSKQRLIATAFARRSARR